MINGLKFTNTGLEVAAMHGGVDIEFTYREIDGLKYDPRSLVLSIQFSSKNKGLFALLIDNVRPRDYTSFEAELQLHVVLKNK